MAKILINGKPVDDLVLREEINIYKQTKERIINFTHNKNISDKEIIEILSKEIEQYRNRIKNQEIIIDTTNDELVDGNIIEIISKTQYANGKPIIKIEYKYKENDNKQEQNTCPPIEIGMTKAY